MTHLELWLRLLRGSADQAESWLAGHNLTLDNVHEDAVLALEADHEQALNDDMDRNLLALGQLRRWRPGLPPQPTWGHPCDAGCPNPAAHAEGAHDL